jgi:FixJ family two-component response regulator
MIPLVAVVDDDFSVRESLESLIRSVGMAVKVFCSAEDLLNTPNPCKANCFILDVRLPGMSGLQLHRDLLNRNCDVPVIFMTAHATDDQAKAEAISDWTVAYLIKPFGEDELLDAVNTALRWKPNA